jgi:hypothetical protein
MDRTKTTTQKNDPECVFFCPGGSLEVAMPGDILQNKVDPLEAVYPKIANMSSGIIKYSIIILLALFWVNWSCIIECPIGCSIPRY